MNSGIFLVLFSSVLFAFVPNSAKIALDDGSSLFFLVFSRYIIGALILLVFIAFIRGNLRIPFPTIPYVVLSSICACILITLTYHAVDYLDVGLVMLILYCFPLGVAFISYFRGKSKIVFVLEEVSRISVSMHCIGAQRLRRLLGSIPLILVSLFLICHPTTLSLLSLFFKIYWR